VKNLQTQLQKPRVFRWVLTFLTKEDTNEINRELPFAALLLTLLAASGVTIYESWKKLCNVHLLPRFQKEAKEIVRQVEVLGYDPLTVMHKRAENTKSKNYREFLLGYISSVRSGGSIVNYLKSKLRSIFEVQSATAIQSVERVGTLVEAYAVMLIVTLCCYILFIVFATTSVFEPMKITGAPGISTLVVCILIFFATPLISVVFMVIAHRERKSNLMTIKQPYHAAIIPLIAVSSMIALISLMPQLQYLTSPDVFPLIVTVSLLTISIPPAVVYMQIAKMNSDAENAMPSFLRDVTESRKIGLSPEKSISHATERMGIGGGSATALEILTEYSEKQKDVEVNKKSLLRPYVLLAFIWSVLIALTTTMVTMTVYALTQISLPGATTALPFEVMQGQVNLFSIGIILQCWLSGFFVGKVNEGTLAAGFKYSAMLVLTAHISLVLSQMFLGDMYGLIS